jgi:hypothetical protein
MIPDSKEVRDEQNTNPVFIGLQDQGGLGRIHEDGPITALATKFGVHDTVIHRWKKETVVSMATGLAGTLLFLQAKLDIGHWMTHYN